MNHDRAYHRLFSHPEMVRDLVRLFIHEPWVADLDLSRLERVNAKLHADNLTQRDGDLIWRLPLTTGGEIYLYLLLELQSRPDRFMALRIAAYVALLHQHLVREGRLTPDGKLPPVFPLVVFNGDGEWTAPTALGDLIALPADSELSRWQPEQRYYLLIVRSAAATDPEAVTAPVEALFALDTKNNRGQAARFVLRLIELVPGPERADLLRAFQAWLAASRLAPLAEAIEAASQGGLLEAKSMLAENVKRWEQELKSEGRREGRQEGRREGEAAVLRRLLQRRFGPLPDWVEQRLDAADLPEFDEWSLRLLEARSLADIFD
jgi:predicted transposase YdaD